MMLYVARCKRAGFTLIEIMIVIAIIAILAAIAIPNIREARAEAQLAACKENILTIVNAMNALMVRHSGADLMGGTYLSGTYLGDTSTGVGARILEYMQDGGYLNEIPRCPHHGKRYTVDILSQDNGFYIYCVGPPHRLANFRIQPAFAMSCGNGGTSSSGVDRCGWQDKIT